MVSLCSLWPQMRSFLVPKISWIIYFVTGCYSYYTVSQYPNICLSKQNPLLVELYPNYHSAFLRLFRYYSGHKIMSYEFQSIEKKSCIAVRHLLPGYLSYMHFKGMYIISHAAKGKLIVCNAHHIMVWWDKHNNADHLLTGLAIPHEMQCYSQ